MIIVTKKNILMTSKCTGNFIQSLFLSFLEIYQYPENILVPNAKLLIVCISKKCPEIWSLVWKMLKALQVFLPIQPLFSSAVQFNSFYGLAISLTWRLLVKSITFQFSTRYFSKFSIKALCTGFFCQDINSLNFFATQKWRGSSHHSFFFSLSQQRNRNRIRNQCQKVHSQSSKFHCRQILTKNFSSRMIISLSILQCLFSFASEQKLHSSVVVVVGSSQIMLLLFWSPLLI